LAREAEICYATLAMVTDYDCWHSGHEAVTVEQVIAVATQNADNATKVLALAIEKSPRARNCACGSALKHAIMTDPKTIPAETRKKLSLMLDKYLEGK